MSAKLALITGASAGIGEAFAKIYAANGYDLVLTARRADRLNALAEQLRLGFGGEIIVLPEDLADPEAPERLLTAIADRGRHVDVLVNNAGFGTPGLFGEQSWKDERRFLEVLLLAVVELTHRVLPGMRERHYGRIVNVASMAGLVPGTASSGMYGATKAFLVRLSQALHIENKPYGVHVSALCPGFTYSEFHSVNDTSAVTAGTPAWLWMGADEVAAAGYEAGEANRPLCIPGAPYKAAAALAKLLPDEWVMSLASQRARRV